ncbi:MAG: hypothetical protein RJQ09_21465 [Cyclobacteriaceae bacterium]
MKVIIKMILIAALTYFGLMYFPWWILVVIAFLVSAVIPGNDFGAFLSGFLGVGILWMAIAWKIDIESGSVMSSKIANMFPVGGDTTMLVIIGGVVGGLAGGFGSLSGNLFRKIWMKKKQKGLYH